MDNNTLFQNGSEWVRADFHLHTKADGEFAYSGDDDAFVKDYVAKLGEQKIRVGVVTNHNKFDRNEFIALKKKASKESICLFPGVEFSLKEGIHILIVFDETWYKGQTDHINELLTSAFLGVNNPANSPRPNSKWDMKDLVDSLKLTGHGYFIILAHIDETNSLFKVLHGRSSYIKIGDFNFDAMRFALMDYKNRVAPKEPPPVNNSRIISITFEGGMLDGKKICFSPELNNLIGIRGSGKSSILEILRYALSLPLGSQAVDTEYKEKLIGHAMKSGGKVIVEITTRQGEIYRVERIYGQKEDIYKGKELQSGITLDAILNQPVYFGQKDLSNKDINFESELVNKFIGNKLYEIQTKIKNKKLEIQKIIGELKNINEISERRKETETVLSTAEYKLRMFEEKGIAEKLAIQAAFETDISQTENYKTWLEGFIEALESVIENNKYLTSQNFSSEVNKELFVEAGKLVRALNGTFSKLSSALEEARGVNVKLDQILSQVLFAKEELKGEFARIKREIDIPELNPDDFLKINNVIEISKLKLDEIDKSEKKRVELDNLLQKTMVELEALWHGEFMEVQREVKKIRGNYDKLSIEIEYKGRKDLFSNYMREVFKGLGICSISFETISAIYADFSEMFKDNFAKLTDILNENQTLEFKKFFLNDLYNLLTFKVDNKVTIKFMDKLLKDHSLGQRASALILFLLAQKENDILIIDQPEDDLDNQTIYEDVISEIKKRKGEMQFIFATHNANIPVLGDSEMLIACECVGEKEIRLETGSIDCPTIQDKIISIMEGGKEAFNIRKNIYKIWENRVS
jgi:ABC-type cobalamin/Fe3+-siderophores transport system ATPase subunit